MDFKTIIKNKPIIIAGNCAIESEEILYKTAISVKKSGATILRGGAFKPRTNPNNFQGLGLPALKMLYEVGKEVSLPTVTEVIDTRDVDIVATYADILQIGSRNMYNYILIKEAAKTGKPILFKRGLSATLNEWKLISNYIINEGNNNIIFCERGIRTYETATRNTLDLSIVPLLKQQVNFPVIVDPSHGTGNASLVIPMAQAGIACGADGLMIEVHCKPEIALCDGDQSLKLNEFELLMKNVKKIYKSLYGGDVDGSM